MNDLTTPTLSAAAPRRQFLKNSLAWTAASSIPGFAIAQAKTLRIGYITALSGPRAPFGVADQWHLAKLRERLKNGIDIGGQKIPVEILLRDNQSDPNRSVQVASELVLREKVDLMLVSSTPETTNPVSDQCEINEIPCISTVAPWQPWFFDWAFNLERGAPIRAKWDRIPAGIDVLVTHGPPAGILDRTVHGLDVGCADLLDAVRRVRPRVHVFGHIHEAHGTLERDGTRFVNASTCTVRYEATNPAVVLDLEP